jgi:hypothetical protein
MNVRRLGVKVFLPFVVLSLGSSSIYPIDIPAPEYQLVEGRLVTSDAAYINPIGAPDVPCRIITVALPPGAIVQGVNFSGVREEIGTAIVEPAQPPLPLIHDHATAELQRNFEESCDFYYQNDNVYPSILGTRISTGGLRKYTLVTVACRHFGYNAVSHALYCAPHINVEVQYTMPDPASQRAEYVQVLMDDVTFDNTAQGLIYNWDQAQAWYRTAHPRRANGYYIIIPAAIQNSVDALVTYRQNQGYDVHVITREYVEANTPGDDLPQKLRNYLRANMADIEFALLVGFSTDMPWRNLVPFNNDPNSPWNNPDYSPIPSDLYLAELTDPDSLSWNSDGDSYYGEVFDANFQPVGEDDPDYHADIHLGRIPFSTQGVIEDICAKLIAFDMNTDVLYKTSSLLTGAVYYYANENGGGNARNDGATYCEQLLIDSVLPRATATTLYEKGGLAPCTLVCTDSLTRTNHVAYWQNKGVMYECHHGNVSLYARKLWAWDDGDSIPENPEITWPTSLYSTDIYQLDNVHPATCFLRSCLCGKPEETGLGAMLLYRGGSAVISSSRICWSSSADPGGIPYHFYARLLQDTTLSHGTIGVAYDIARNNFMANTGFWIPAYHYNLFGDPALRQFGQIVNIEENKVQTPARGLVIFPNPSKGTIRISIPSSSGNPVIFDFYDVSGRLVSSLQTDEAHPENKSYIIRLPAGVYFVTSHDRSIGGGQKVVVTD